ncbi:hypothetical protein OSCI_410022 [Kamptonema sp. PCC 6506]|nr:hypothetical protein OSCI_410022 [Kamptonema sp. PCC 6506]
MHNFGELVLTGDFPRNFAQNQDPFLAVLQTDAVPIRDRLHSVPKELAKAVDNPRNGRKSSISKVSKVS